MTGFGRSAAWIKTADILERGLRLLAHPETKLLIVACFAVVMAIGVLRPPSEQILRLLIFVIAVLFSAVMVSLLHYVEWKLAYSERVQESLKSAVRELAGERIASRSTTEDDSTER